MPKSLCLNWTYGRPGIDYRVAFHKVPNCYRNNPLKFEIDGSILTCRNERKGPNCLRRTAVLTDGRMDVRTLNVEKLHF